MLERAGQVRHLEREMVRAGAVPRDESREEVVLLDRPRLQQLHRHPVAIRGADPHLHRTEPDRLAAEDHRSAQSAGEKAQRVGRVGGRQRNMVEVVSGAHGGGRLGDDRCALANGGRMLGRSWHAVRVRTDAADRPIEKEYRNVVSDNLRWEKFVARPGDIFVCTPPKCGTTWMQTIVVSLLFPDGDVPGRVTQIVPWIDARFEPIDAVLARLDAQTHRRSIKTHTAADGIPWFPEASYIVVGRDGRDAFMSFHNHMANMKPELMLHLVGTAIEDGIDLGTAGIPPVDDIHEFYRYWLDENFLFEHIASFWAHHGEPNVYFVHYDDMKADLESSMRGVAQFLGIDIDESRWPELVERCTFESMKARSDEIGDFMPFIGGADTFLYKGTNGRWRDVLTDAELAEFERHSAENLPADAAKWLNRA